MSKVLSKQQSLGSWVPFKVGHIPCTVKYRLSSRTHSFGLVEQAPGAHMRVS